MPIFSRTKKKISFVSLLVSILLCVLTVENYSTQIEETVGEMTAGSSLKFFLVFAGVVLLVVGQRAADESEKERLADIFRAFRREAAMGPEASWFSPSTSDRRPGANVYQPHLSNNPDKRGYFGGRPSMTVFKIGVPKKNVKKTSAASEKEAI